MAGSDRLADRLAALNERVDRAARRAGRSLADVTVVAATKTVPPDRVREAWVAGLRHIGENRVQEAASKREILQSDPAGRDAVWHLIGHLQSNKAKKAVELFDAVQSLDSLPLAELLDREAAKRGRILPCLVEVKVSEEPAKHGLPLGALDEFLDKTAALKNLRVEGLMTVAPFFEDPADARPYFARTRALFEKDLKRFQGAVPRLSMGMSHDFEAALEEGSTMIRIGTALFGARPVTEPWEARKWLKGASPETSA